MKRSAARRSGSGVDGRDRLRHPGQFQISVIALEAWAVHQNFEARLGQFLAGAAAGWARALAVRAVAEQGRWRARIPLLRSSRR